MKIKKLIIIVTVIALVLLSTITWLVGSYFVDFALKRGNDTDPEAPPKAATGIITPNLQPPSKPSYENQVWNISVNGEKRTATAFYTTQKTDRWIIMIHGYCRNQCYIWNYADDYLSHGFNVLTPDLNASGKSEGQYLTMGIKESKDIAAWTKLLLEKSPKARIVLHGVSMGAATAMMATQENLPANVYAVIEDCGYSSAYEMYALQAKKLFGLPKFPLLNMIDIVHKIKLGCYMSDAKPLIAVKQNQLPLLIIHGDSDTLVPVTMAEEIYAASVSRFKRKHIVPGADHASSIDKGRSAYFSLVYSFLEEVEQRAQ